MFYLNVYIQVGKIPNLDVHRHAVTSQLMACQNYMRHRPVTCYIV